MRASETATRQPIASRRFAPAIATALALLVGGCNEQASRPSTGGANPQAMSARNREDTFRYAADLLNNVETLNSDPTPKEKQNTEQAARKLIYGNTPAVLTEQLNRWMMTQKASPDWKRDPLVDGLPEPLRKLPDVENLDAMRFTTADGAALREAVWLRGISNLACGDAVATLERAQRLFDWTVRNIQLTSAPTGDDAKPALPCLPWHVLLLGRGSAEDRAWLFMLLARQQGLDVVLLRPAEAQRAALLGLLDASDKDGEQVYLFDAQLGLPLPGPAGQGVATLAQIAQDDQLLRQLDLDAEHAYPLSSSDVAGMTAEIEASPLYLQQRTALVESKLSGDQKLALSVEPSALVKRLQKVPQIGRVELWQLPYERLLALTDRKSEGIQRLTAELEPFVAPFPHKKKKQFEVAALLWRGRVQHLAGNFTGDTGANYYYQLSRPPDAEIEQFASSHGSQLEQITDPQVKAQLAQAAQTALRLLRTTKQDASYWLGLVAFERGNYTTAIDYFEKRTLEASPDGPWTSGARYNLGRAYEALAQLPQAIDAYRIDDSPQRHGNLLRARRLEAEKKPAEKEPGGEPKAPGNGNG